MKSFEPGTENNIAKQIDGSRRGPITKEFIKKMIQHSCLTLDKVVDINGHEYPTYMRDRNQMIKLWKKTIYFRISRDIINEKLGKKEGPFGISALDEIFQE